MAPDYPASSDQQRSESDAMKEKYLREAGKIEDFPDPENASQDGHVREWSDRARVIADIKEEAGAIASPNQSPAIPETVQEDVEEKSEAIKPLNNETPY
jgi:hypothetical protein